HYTFCVLSLQHYHRPYETYSLSLHDSLPICEDPKKTRYFDAFENCASSGTVRANSLDFGKPTKSSVASWSRCNAKPRRWRRRSRSEEHTSELQSRENLVCRLLLEKKKQNKKI